MEELVKQAKDFGFTGAVSVDVSTIQCLPEVRDMCSVNICQKYDTNWCCPPACGTIEECAKKASKYTEGMIVQTTAKLEDPFDYEEMINLQKAHQNKLLKFTPILREQVKETLPLGTEACLLCPDCTYPDNPCRFPDLAFPPMEAFGIFVSDLCAKNNIPYYYGESTLTYVSLFLINK